MATNSNLDRKKQRAIVALLVNATVKDAAKEARIGYTTLIRWMQEPDFKAELRHAQSEQLGHATARLSGELTAAIATLSKIHKDDSQPASARVRAAALVMDYFMKFTDAYDLTERVEALENLLGANRS